jgi:transposase
MKARRFNNEFKKHLVEQALSGSMNISELSRKHEICRTLIYKWQKEYERGELDNQPNNPQFAAELKVKELESLVGRLVMENEVLKKALRLSNCALKPNASSSEKTKVYSGALRGGAKC